MSTFNFLSCYTDPDMQKFSVFKQPRSMLVKLQKKLLIKEKTSSTWWVLLWQVLWMISVRIVDFRFFFNFHRSGPAKIFNFWTTTVDVSYTSKKLLMKQKISSTLSVFLWKDYGWFLTDLSILYFLSNFKGPDRQKFSIFELPRWMLVIHQKSS